MAILELNFTNNRCSLHYFAVPLFSPIIINLALIRISVDALYRDGAGQIS